MVLPNGVDDFWFDTPKSAKPRGQTRFLMVGRNEYRKGFHVLQEALSMLEEPIELHLVGDWPQIKPTQHSVTYHGVVRDKHKLITIVDSCDVLLLPSLSEGMPTVVLEAKARGLKVIGTEVGAMGELEEKLLPPSDFLALAAAIEESKDMGRRQKLSEQFRWTQVALATRKSKC